MEVLRPYFQCLANDSKHPIQKADGTFMLAITSDIVEFESQMTGVNWAGAASTAADIADEESSIWYKLFSLGMYTLEEMELQERREEEWRHFSAKLFTFKTALAERSNSFRFVDH